MSPMLFTTPPTLVVYTSQNCPGCVQLKSKLKAEGKPFVEMQIGKDLTMDEFKAQYPDVRSVPHQVELS